MGIRSNFSEIAAKWEDRAARAPEVAQAVLEENARLVFAERRKLLAPITRTGKLAASETLSISAGRAEITNTAPYAGIRHARPGGNWGPRAMEATAGTRAANIRAAMRRMNE